MFEITKEDDNKGGTITFIDRDPLEPTLALGKNGDTKALMIAQVFISPDGVTLLDLNDDEIDQLIEVLEDTKG